MSLPIHSENNNAGVAAAAPRPETSDKKKAEVLTHTMMIIGWILAISAACYTRFRADALTVVALTYVFYMWQFFYWSKVLQWAIVKKTKWWSEGLSVGAVMLLIAICLGLDVALKGYTRT